ncbi:MAG: peptide deformylase [Calditrichaceae bacterium]|nr:peptide deformylase [Calditrichaceae bacterium]MBN2708217.1 peptide deformylase [Calditrichaceae bacterium]RQV92241.1 MAG: peptide deformylase [Calditrichota bacterium]
MYELQNEKKTSIRQFIKDLHYNDMRLYLYPDQVLRDSTNYITAFDSDLHWLATRMFDSMRLYGGIGLAAPQIGLSSKIVAVDIEGMHNFLINPEILSYTLESEIKSEGCLSIPGRTFDIDRSLKIEVIAYNLAGKKLHFEAKGFTARVIQHEIDHLNGVLICDNEVKK